MPNVEIDDKELADLRKAAKDGAKAVAQAEALACQLSEARAGATRLAELEEQAKGWQAERLEATFTGAGIKDPKVRRVFQLEFDEQAAVEGGEKDLGKYLASVQALPADKRPAVLAPFLGAAGNPAGPGQRTGVLPADSKGAKDLEGAPPEFTPESIAQMTAAEFSAALPRMALTNPELAGIRVPASSLPPTGDNAQT